MPILLKPKNQRLNDQVEKVLQIARVEQDNFQLNMENVVLADLINSVLNSVELKIHEKEGQLKRSIQIGTTVIKADKHHLTNVLHNLLDNALKYVKKTPLIEVSAVQKNGAIQLSITDNGIGIKKDYHNKVFQKFYRVPTGNIHDVKGFGLGLFYIKNICEAHGWIVHLDSEIDQGTTLSILIPKAEKAGITILEMLKNKWRLLSGQSAVSS